MTRDEFELQAALAADAYVAQMGQLFDLLGQDGVERMIQSLLAPDENGNVTPENQQKAQALAEMIGRLLSAREAAAAAAEGEKK